MEIFNKVLNDTLMITGFVVVVMMIIEYVNTRTQGTWTKFMNKNPLVQILLATFLGLIPGCLGTYTVVSLFTHNLMGLGALVAVMIATTGDEAFFMFSMIPVETLWITLILAILAILSGLIVHFVTKGKRIAYFNTYKFHVHEGEKVHAKSSVLSNLKKISFSRALLLFGLSVFIISLLTNKLEHIHLNPFESQIEKISDLNVHEEVIEHEAGHIHEEDSGHEADHLSEDHGSEHLSDAHEHDHGDWNWVKISFLLVSLIALIIVLIVPEHFLHEHLWEHIIRKHLLRIVLWTFAILLAIEIGIGYFDLTAWINANFITVLLIAVIVGFIPESGPHLLFIALYMNGTVPLSILLANSVVQDGHGALPLFAESKKTFTLVKGINMIVGLAVGLSGYFFGF